MENPIRILHVFGRLDSGGAESRTMDIYRSIDRSKVQFDFVIHTKDECFYSKEVRLLGGKIFKFPRFNGKNYFTYKKTWDHFFKKNNEYKIIHGHQTNTGFVYLNEAKKNNIPVRIAHSRNSNKENFIKKHICKLVRYYATNLFAVSKLAAESEFGKKELRNGNVKIIPNAINAKKYIYAPEIREVKRKELGLTDELAICHIGRFHAQKNHYFLLSVFKYLKKQNNGLKLILIGDGHLRAEIENQIQEFELKDSVILTGIRSDVHEIMQAMDILVFPSLFEGLPGVVLEAQAAGLPSIISDRITDEVKVTNLVSYFSLEKSEREWGEKILKILECLERRNTYEEIENSGYDIISVAKWYQEFYLLHYN